MKRKYRYKLSYKGRKLVFKAIFTIIIAILDVILYHYLGVLGSYVGENNWVNAFVLVGWFWLLAGQFMALHYMWEW